MKKTVLTAVFATSIGLCAMTAASADQTKIGVAAEPYPPFSVADSAGVWSGWEIDIANAICAEAKLDCIVSPTPWDGLIPALEAGKIDLIMSSMSITQERMKTIDFSNKYYNTPAVVVAHKGSDTGPASGTLQGKAIGLQAGTIHASYAKKHFSTASEIREYQTQDEAFQDLAAGRIDAVQADSIAANAFLKSMQGVDCCESKGAVEPDEAILGAGVGAGLRKGDTALADKINQAIAALRTSGKYQEISGRYFDFDIYGD